jgi:hypothetical protein
MTIHSHSVTRHCLHWTVLVLIIVSSASFARAQETIGDVEAALSKGIELSQTFKDAADQFTGPLEQVTDSYTKLADAVVGGHNPPKPATPYSIDDLSNKAEAAASILNAANLLPAITPGDYTVSIDDLRGCSTQDAALAKLNEYAAAMDKEVTEGQNTISYLTAYGNAANSIYAYIQELEHDSGVLAATPNEFDGYFIGKWSDLSSLSTAIAHMQDAARDQLKRVQSNVSALQTQVGNLHSNLNLIRPGSCLLIGQWSGTCTMVNLGLTSSGTLMLSNSSGQQGSFTLASTLITANSPSISTKTHLNMTLGQSKSPFQGDFNAQYSQFTGTLAGPGTISYKCNLNGAGH